MDSFSKLSFDNFDSILNDEPEEFPGLNFVCDLELLPKYKSRPCISDDCDAVMVPRKIIKSKLQKGFVCKEC